MLNKLDEVSSQILKILRDNKNGLTISNISQMIGIYRSTASKYLLALQREGLVASKKVGPAKIYYIPRKKDHVHNNVQQKVDNDEDWIDSFIDEIKEEIKEELLKEGIR
ncbi:MAG: winged helix-turn-helix transcriptional regulator [Candidatus Aenigmarchaeota archaeon]|nr:winged helix-turn-helix transcriptional regulator [Candidatus Aenigmarchaeota archaeon]